MSDARLRGLAALVGLALLGVIVAGAGFGSVSVADDLQPRAEQALTAAGFDSVRVELDGREATISGGMPEELSRAELVVEGVDGIRWVDVVRGTAANPAPLERDDTTPTLDLRRTPRGIALAGTVPDADAAVGIKVRAAEVFGVPVTGDLVIDPAVGSSSWVTELSDVLGEVVAVKGLRLTIDGSGTLELVGTIESEAGADRIRRIVGSVVTELDLMSRLDVVPGDLSEADAAVLNSSTLTFLSGSTRLGRGGERTLDVVADVLARNTRVSIEAGGHAGPDDPAAGERLSKARVAAVKAYLVRAGIEAGRISTRSYTADPEATTDPTAEQYRRVDFIVKEQ